MIMRYIYIVEIKKQVTGNSRTRSLPFLLIQGNFLSILPINIIMASSLFIFKSLIFSHLLLVSAEGSKCPQSFDCGSLGQISFPFTDREHPQCGALAIHGCHDKDPAAPKTIQLTNTPSKRSFKVILMGRSTIAVRDNDQDKNLENKSCKAFFNNFTLPPPSPLASFYIGNNITMFRCNNSLNVTLPISFHNYSNSNCSGGYNIYYYSLPNTKIPPGFKWPSFLASSACSAVQVAVRDDPTDNPFDFLVSELNIHVQLSDDCNHCLRQEGGQCQLDIQGKFYCAKENKGLLRKLGLGIGLPSIIITGLLIIWHYKRRHVPDFPDPERGSNSVCFGIPIFSYKDLQVATKNFDRSRELGEGGFGIVFYGKLKDGREVAVKRLYEHNYRRVEQFVNEVNILTRLRHRNLVSLYGCTSRHGHELLLVYEYIPNGTVASHLRRESTNPGFLPWHIRMKVALETAIALAYLHASDIIHRDVKTNNILLDNNFCVKVADFGLSRLFPNDVTHVSTAPQGTPGYVDPEYHQCYQLTSKSDVYSFGVVLIELISSMPAVDMSRHKDEINLANLAIRKIQKSAIGELVDPFLGFESDRDVRREIVSIAELAFQCLQRDKELRPSMDEAVEVLRRIESGEDEEEVISHGDVVHPLSPSSPDHDEVKLLTASPKAVTDKWGSDSTTPNVSGQSQSQL